MKKILCLVALALCLCLAAGSAFAAAKTATSPKKATAPAKSEEMINSELHKFAIEMMTAMNRLSLPSKNKPEVLKNPDGTWTARYIEVDLNSITTGIRAPKDTTHVQYVGYMRYLECNMVSTAATKEAALAGPFLPKNKEGLTELVKYMKGKWGY